MQTAPHPDLLQGALPLTDWALIRALGDDARSFLQGQLTQDVLLWSEDQARPAGYCSPKGRLLASFVLWQRGPQEVMLACSADLLAPTLKRLSMYVLRAKCKLSDATAERPLLGLAGAAAVQALGEAAPAAPWQRRTVGDADVLRLPDAAGTPRFLWSGPGAPANLPTLAPEAWAWLEVRSAVPRVVAATVEQFVPQMVNLEAVGGVNFKKGCYPGQEVVARSQYRGTLKRRAFLFEVAGTPAPGQEIFAAAEPEQPAGMVVNVAAVPGTPSRWALLAETKIALSDGALHLGAPDGPLLQGQPLPYALPTEV
jgi:folate-binding protein YgfZ